MKDSEVLKKARQRIADGHASMICFAISNTAGATKDQIIALHRWVTKMLAPYGSYSDWLYGNHRAFASNVIMSHKSYKEGRVQWLDWMIAYCEKEEAEVERQKKLMHLRARLARTKTAQGKINLMNKIERLERGAETNSH